jgi:hypothetical protein
MLSVIMLNVEKFLLQVPLWKLIGHLEPELSSIRVNGPTMEAEYQCNKTSIIYRW